MPTASAFRAAVFCPQPPLLVTAVGANEPVAVRAAAVDAVRWLCAERPQRVVVVGAAASADCFPPGSHGSFAGYGVDFAVQLPGGDEPTGRALPLPLAVGAWLLQEVGYGEAAVGLTCNPAGELPTFAADDSGDVGLLVMGDGSARRTEKAPGWLDERAAAYDAGVRSALASGDPAELAVDLELGAQLLAAGAPAWRAASRLLAGSQYAAEVCYDDAPYGVGYLVARWAAEAR